MPSDPPTIVRCNDISAAGDAVAANALVRVESDTLEGLLDAVRSAGDPAGLLVAVDSAVRDKDELVAIVSVLIVEGVQAFETSERQAVQRILDTHRTIVHGAIDAIVS